MNRRNKLDKNPSCLVKIDKGFSKDKWFWIILLLIVIGVWMSRVSIASEI